MNTNGAEFEAIAGDVTPARLFKAFVLDANPTLFSNDIHQHAEIHFPKTWQQTAEESEKIKKAVDLFWMEEQKKDYLLGHFWLKMSDYSIGVSSRIIGCPYGKREAMYNGFIVGGDASTKHGSSDYVPEQHIDISKGEGVGKLLQIIPTFSNVSFMTVAEQAVAGVMANRIASSNASLVVNFMEVGVVFGLSFKLAGIALQEKYPKGSIWMTKISHVTTASAIVLSLVEHLPPVMGWIAGPISFLIIAASVACS